MPLTEDNFYVLGRSLEGFFFGLYSGIFALHLRYHISKDGNNLYNVKQYIIFYALGLLYVFSLVVLALDVATFAVGQSRNKTRIAYHLDISEIPIFAFCDFIAQSILIHRCWIVWGSNTRVVIIPSILAFVYLAMWIAGAGSFFINRGQIDEAGWGDTVALTSLTASMTVNALVTGLIVFRIFKVFRKVKSTATSDEKSLDISGGKKLRSIIFVIIESGMILFAIQLARVLIAIPKTWTDAGRDAHTLIASIHTMLNGITPTIIQVRVSMGLSFYDETSMVETVSSLQFAADNLNAIPGEGSTSRDGSLDIGSDDPSALSEMEHNNRETGDNDFDGADGIQMVDR